jgi:hypothetical protein
MLLMVRVLGSLQQRWNWHKLKRPWNFEAGVETANPLQLTQDLTPTAFQVDCAATFDIRQRDTS